MALLTHERDALDAISDQALNGPIDPHDPMDLARAGLWISGLAMDRINTARFEPGALTPTMKNDGTPVTRLEPEIEKMIEHRLSPLIDGVKVIGEERGGIVQGKGITVSIDPIDGTWAFLSQISTYATTLCFFSDGKPIVGLVVNPSTGEMYYGGEGISSRLVHRTIGGAGDEGVDLPMTAAGHKGPVLVNLHPSKDSKILRDALGDMWKANEIQLLRSVAGSPAYFIAETVRGYSYYINAWSQRESLSYDLVAALLIIRGGGGDVWDSMENSIAMDAHQGPFMSGIRQEAHESIISQVCKLM